MTVQTRNFGEVYLGQPPEGLFIDEPLLTDAEATYLRPRFRDNLSVGWAPFVDTVADFESDVSQFWVLSSTGTRPIFMGIMHVFEDYHRTQDSLSRPPHNWSSYILLRENFWGSGLAGDMRRARLWYAFEHMGLTALHATINSCNKMSRLGIENIGGVNIGPDAEEKGRDHYITVKPSQFDCYWEDATCDNHALPKLIPNTVEMKDAFGLALPKVEDALRQARETFTQHPSVQ